MEDGDASQPPSSKQSRPRRRPKPKKELPLNPESKEFKPEPHKHSQHPVKPKISNHKPTQSSTSRADHSQLASEMIERLEKNTYECLICTEVIKRHVTVWTCNQCHMIFHLFCIKKWSRSSDSNDAQSWRCPGCQFIHVAKPVPKCFCGKVSDPPIDPYNIPHSCGEVCGKIRGIVGKCSHRCTMQCHPGFCPPCTENGPDIRCHCGKMKHVTKCGSKEPTPSCGEVCGKDLPCGKHTCEKTCHSGECGQCPVTAMVTCYCGKVTEEKSCGYGKLDMTSKSPRYFSCQKECGHTLSCGHHTCQMKCHSGVCHECPFLPKLITTCPCGKLPITILADKPRTSCTDDIPTCANVCGKMLPCGQHTCKAKCHLGDCSECQEPIKVPCRCHSTLTTAPCSVVHSPNYQPAICQKICKMKKICGRHACGNKCCPSTSKADPHGRDESGAHICSLICGKKLGCGNHRCDMLCHAGNCPPCHVFSHEAYVCECGKTRIDPPIKCGTIEPSCPHVCIRPRPCGHHDNHKCHSVNQPCPNCTVMTEKMCAGGHETKKNVMCYINEVSCGKLCDKLLSCGNHRCKRSCHSGPCVPPDELGVMPPQDYDPEHPISCGKSCDAKRPICGHPCKVKCHPNQPCPSIPCTQRIPIKCACGRRSVDGECLRGGPNDVADKPQRQLECDGQCALEARSRQLAAAFGAPLNSVSSLYSDFLVQVARASPSFILQVEQTLSELIRSTDSERRFPPQDRLQRRIIHEMAKAYNVTTESYDQEPHRSLVVTKKRSSKVPVPLLSQVINKLNNEKQGPPPSSHNSHSLASGVVNISKEKESFALHLYDLDTHIKTHHIVSQLYSFEGHYQLKWLDDQNALVIFSEYAKMKAALFILSNHFHVVQFKEFKAQSNDAPSSSEPKPLPTHQPYQPSWQSNQNAFELLEDSDEIPKEQFKEKTMDESKKTWSDLARADDTSKEEIEEHW
eukprot:TRINITY_DN7128_c0_g1_i1.p1 TRINITY_DN7128_c0_g1~~TRINITY_DN7128_c0_g1_i1.p1  ORF type:complete len:1079 (-),score=167.14 TRINITY_DN7128_c0_g1_i1:35-2926(-)